MDSHSIHGMSRDEVARAVANRFVHSRIYVALYLVMAALSAATVALSLSDGCPGTAFYVLEIIVNTAMIAEVSVRFLAFGRQFWKSPFNILDLVLTALCVITLLVLFLAGCGNTSKEEEILDTLLLVFRNVMQFGRLAAVMRQSGQSLFSRPKNIDLSLPTHHNQGYTRLDIDLEDDIPDWSPHERAPPSEVVFDADPNAWQDHPPPRKPNPNIGINRGDPGESEDLWAGL
ncbi:Cation channel family transporter [Ceratobasidium theobromae]|uniref:Cation channel family transporter n=1 Tax=Ceratobasidium theobromae TaxID=1582974 RepID=A0A5N5QLS9_9AGAM|nr:Cation channel family transporter [Ceratobasidium theobromae]